jgi:hypothetical protein
VPGDRVVVRLSAGLSLYDLERHALRLLVEPSSAGLPEHLRVHTSQVGQRA